MLAPFVRFFYKHFYNRFAFTYDWVSALVSRGEWRAWTRAGIPFVRGPRVLEVAFGTGNLQLDLNAAGFAPLGVDLSPYMGDITRRKLQARQLPLRLVRASVPRLPFPDSSFDSLITTFPPGFAMDPHAMNEMRRVLAVGGSLVWVDSPYLYPRDPWSRFLNWMYHSLNAAPKPPEHGQQERAQAVKRAGLIDRTLEEWLPEDGWTWRIERVERPQSYIHVIIGQKEGP